MSSGVTPIGSAVSRRERIVRQAMKDGMLAERQRIVAWLEEVRVSLEKEPASETPVGDEFTPEAKTGALGIVQVLHENLSAEL